jgi:hypothetical protein
MLNHQDTKNSKMHQEGQKNQSNSFAFLGETWCLGALVVDLSFSNPT